MKSTPSHKLGANRKEMAQKHRKHDANFSQSRDIREDRGERREKFVHQPQTTMSHLGRSSRAKERKPLLLPEHARASKRPVVVKLNHPDAKTVTLAGTFNGWNPEATPLRRVGECEWVVELSLPAGAHEYRFIVDGQWVDDPDAETLVDNGFGGRNCLLEIL
jgi:hypothetical protein